MTYGCPNPECQFFEKKDHIVNDGTYFRNNDSRVIKRFRCKSCGKRFSSATFSSAKGQKKRRINETLKLLLSSGVSMRRSALLLHIHRTTVHRKLIFLAKESNSSHAKFLDSLKTVPAVHIQFDDLITIEHTKLKPLTISLAVDRDTRKVLGAEVGQIPSFGKLAEKSRKKYGYRKCYHVKTMKRLFSKIKPSIASDALLESDEHPHYPGIVKTFFKNAKHETYKGGRGCVVGQGELKQLKYDPLFTLNHTCAMFRANINRLIRKTWCTTKDPQMLQKHIDIFIDYYNNTLLA